jgi:O-antigen ligase
VKLQQKAVTLAGLLYIAMAVFHIPDQVFRHGFDKNAPAQFFALLVIGVVFSLFIVLKAHRFHFHRLAIYGAAALIGTQFLSLLMSGNFIASLVGDVGRFVGVASTVALLLVSIFHTQFNFEGFMKLLRFYIVAVELVVLIGIAQRLNFVELPGDQGIASTLGNSDFFAAFVGTAFPLLFLLALNSSRHIKIALGSLAVLNFWALYLAGPLQGYLDVAFAVVGILILAIRNYLPRRNLSLNARTYIGTFAVIIWAEFIFLMPFIGHFVPVLGNDIQVKIRSNFWLAGMRQFFSHPFTGVGPDQYGNYYEQYRTLADIQQYTNIISNDAHSASVQTLATTGILGTAAFIFLIALVIRSLLILWDAGTINRKSLFAIGLYIFIYLTNSFVSPITLTHKFLFWAVCGFIVGQVYRLPSRKSANSAKPRALAVSGAATLAVIAALFAQGQLNFLSHIEKYAADNKQVSNYSSTAMIPCMMYFDAELLMTNTRGAEAGINFAKDKALQNPRCVSALIAQLRAEVNSGRVNTLKPLVYKLHQIAPARSETIALGMYYVNRTGDPYLAKILQHEMKVLGLAYVPGNLG